MKKLSLFIFASLFLTVGVQAQEIEFSQLLTMQNKSAMAKFEELESKNVEKSLSLLLQFERTPQTKSNYITSIIFAGRRQLFLPVSDNYLCRFLSSLESA